ncbi:MAG: sodium-dependent transporter [Clostridiales bacterium]|nr:sodium-dependent transporter [Clostridiales bacterium]
MEKREKLGSRLGFILLSAGCAIGVGNVWKFPYMVGQNGGGIFVLIYLFFLIAMGVPVMTMEFSLGRASQKSMTKLYDELEPKGSKWHFHGYAALIGNILLMMFYTVVCGWLLQYFVKMLGGDFTGVSNEVAVSQYSEMLANPWMQMLFTGIVIVIGFLVCAFGVKNSLERVTKVMMIALLVIMVALAINGFFMEGTLEGLKFYLVPNIDNVKEVGIFNVITGAMSQAFFTLSLGIGSMAIFGSYLDKDRSLFGEAINVAVLDTLVAIIAGLIIFPACFTYNNGNVNAGPPLIFETLPNIFNNMPLGRLWGSLFFLFLTFAALSTVFAVFENIIACVQDLTKWSRKKICIIGTFAMFVLALPCILGFNVLSGFAPFGEGSVVLDLEDFIVSNLLLPIGSFVFVMFCTSKYGWGYDNFVNEANQGKGLKVQKWMKVYFKYVLPILLFAFIIISIVTFFL